MENHIKIISRIIGGVKRLWKYKNKRILHFLLKTMYKLSRLSSIKNNSKNKKLKDFKKETYRKK